LISLRSHLTGVFFAFRVPGADHVLSDPVLGIAILEAFLPGDDRNSHFAEGTRRGLPLLSATPTRYDGYSARVILVFCKTLHIRITMTLRVFKLDSGTHY
jgi:hypothetical protein